MVKITLSEGKFLNTLKSWPFRAENNAQTTSEQLQTNFQKVQKRLLTQNMIKRPSQMAKINVTYQPLQLKIHPKVDD